MIYEGFAMFDTDNNILGERYTEPELAIHDAFLELFEYSTLEEMRTQVLPVRNAFLIMIPKPELPHC